MHRILRPKLTSQVFASFRFIVSESQGGWGSGAGKGGGSGGSIRDAGGAFGKMQAAREEEYFRKLQQEQIENLREKFKREICHQEGEIQRRKEEIKMYKKKIEELTKDLKNCEE